MSTETSGIDPYALVLADLHAKRDQINQTIALLEAMRSGGMASVVAPGTLARSPELGSAEQVADPGDFLSMTIPDATLKLLASRRKVMGNAEIASALKAGGLVLNSADPVNTIGSVLTRRFNQVGDIVRVGRGTWGLKAWYPNRNFKGASKSAKGEPEAPASDEEPASQEPASASVSFMITQAQKAKLRDLGHDDEAIKNMKPEEAHELLRKAG